MPRTHETSTAPMLRTWLGRLTAAAGLVAAASVALAQPAPTPATAPLPGPAPTGLVVGSGNPFSPIVADLDAAAAALVEAGGTFVSTGGRPLDLPAGSSTLKVGIVRDPDNLFLVLIQAPPPAPQ